MKIFHTSDWHLGRMLYGRSLLSEQEYFINEVFLPDVEREKPDCVMICGDIYDRQIAPTAAIRLFSNTLSQLVKIGCRVAVISGNHDGADRMAIMKDVLKTAGVHIATDIADLSSPLEIERDDVRAQIFTFPYSDTVRIRDFFADQGIRDVSAAMKRAIDDLAKPAFKDGYVKILLSHAFVAGSSTSDSESTIFVGGSADVSGDVFNEFDYVALGHLHRAQRAGKKGRYSGSPLKYSVDEAQDEKGFTRIEILAGSMEVEHITAVPIRDIRKISGYFEDLVLEGKKGVCDDYIEITLLDDVPVLMAAEKLREYYKNLLPLRYKHVAGNFASVSAREKLEGKDELTIFKSFYNEMTGEETNKAQEDMFMDILREEKGRME